MSLALSTHPHRNMDYTTSARLRRVAPAKSVMPQVVRSAWQSGFGIRRKAQAVVVATSLCMSYSAVPKRPVSDVETSKISVSSGVAAFDPVEDRNAELASSLTSYRLLGEDWDGDGAVAPLPDSINAALAFIDLLPLDAKPNGTMLEGSGEAGFYWKKQGVFIDVSFGPDTIIYYARVERHGDSPYEVMGTRDFSGKSMPADLITAITMA